MSNPVLQSPSYSRPALPSDHPPAAPALPSITGRIEHSIEYTSKLAAMAEEIADRLFGEPPTGDKERVALSPVPSGRVAETNAALDRLVSQLDRLADAIGRLEFVG